MNNPVVIVGNPEDFPSGSSGAATWNNGRSISTTPLAAAEERTVISTTTETVIEYLEMAVPVADQVYLRLLPKAGGVTLPLAVLGKDGSATYTFAPANIIAHGHALIEVIEYDTVASAFKIALRLGLTFAGGIDVFVKNGHPTVGYNCAYSAVWRYR